MSQNAASPIRLAHIDPSKLWTGNVWNPVKASHSLIQVGVLSVEDVENASVLPNQILEEQFRLPAHRQAKAVVEIRKLFNIRLQNIHVLKLQPLAREVLYQSRGFRVAQHAADLCRQHSRLA